ncbi:hypothetical protein EPO05_02560 [Patescibacteria group bacterium]|nr:MAG: hypothetical protein EPO05_02560 [Patescibacteria group bacterium]
MEKVGEKSGNYGSWTIAGDEAFLRLDESSRVKLAPSQDGVLLEGWWGEARRLGAVISGVCLMDGSWQMEFAQQDKRNPPARRSLALTLDRERAYGKAKKGGVTKLLVPRVPGGYHRSLIRWQAKKFAALCPERILYHLPIDEYHLFIEEMEASMGRRVTEMHEALESFGQETLKFLNEALVAAGVDPGKVELIHPLSLGAKGANESFGFPYLKPEAFKLDLKSLAGVEDLVELRISLAAEKEQGWRIPVFCGVLDLPHPYCAKERDAREVREIIL